MAASLLIMVCGITGKSKKKEDDWPLLSQIKSSLLEKRDELIALSREDAIAYDSVVIAAKKLRAIDEIGARRELESSLKHASEIPLRTASACIAVLDYSMKVAELGIRGAWTDTAMAVLLAEAGFKGAAMNVETNLKDISDAAFVISSKAKLKEQDGQAREMIKRSLSKLSSPSI